MKIRFPLVHENRLWRSGALVGAAAVCLLVLNACSDTEAPRDNTAMLPEDQRVSSVPWNKPQGWEDQGALGALANDPRVNGGAQQ